MYPSSHSEACKGHLEGMAQRLAQAAEIAGKLASGYETAGNSLGTCGEAASMVREDLTTRRGRVLQARSSAGNAAAALDAPDVIISPSHSDVTSANSESLAARQGLDASNEKLGLATQMVDTEGKILDETGKKALEEAAKFKQLAKTLGELLSLVHNGRTTIDTGQ